MEACYRENLATVDDAVGAILSGADRDTVVHEVFYKLLTRPELRNSFSGSSFSAWLRAVARHHAIDVARRRGREVPCPTVTNEQHHGAVSSPEETLAARQTIEKLRVSLPPRFRLVFDTRYIQQQTQRQAADTLGMQRTTLGKLERRLRRRIGELTRQLEA
jgi:RNA polymerase sigma-70 factor (ECF subfamily)